MRGRDIHPIVVTSDGDVIPPPDEESNTLTPLYAERQKAQTLVNLSYISQRANGYLPLSGRLPHGKKFDLPQTHLTENNKTLLVIRLHIEDLGQMLGIKSLNKYDKRYTESLFTAMEQTQIHQLMEDDVKRYWPENSLHGEQVIDLVLPYIYKTGKSSTFRAFVPKHWGMILFGRLTEKLTLEPSPENLRSLEKYGDQLAIPEKFLFDRVPKDYCGIWAPCKEPEVCKKIHPDRLTEEKLLEIKHESLLAVVNYTLANKVECEQCGKFFSGRRALYGHLVAAHGFNEPDWVKNNPPEPHISIRKLVVPPAEIRSHQNQMVNRLQGEIVEQPEGKINKIESMVKLTNYRKQPKNKAYWKRKISIPKWLKPLLVEKILGKEGKQLSKGEYPVQVDLLWHSPRIELTGAHGRQVTTLPTKWERSDNEVIQERPVRAIGSWDGNSNHILFDPQDNEWFAEWNEQGIKADMIVLASFTIF